MAQHAPERPNVARVVTQTCGAQEHPLHTLQTCQATLGTLQLVVHRGVFASPLSIAQHGQPCSVSGSACKARPALATPSDCAAALPSVGLHSWRPLQQEPSFRALQPSMHHPVLASPRARAN